VKKSKNYWKMMSLFQKLKMSMPKTQKKNNHHLLERGWMKRISMNSAMKTMMLILTILKKYE